MTAERWTRIKTIFQDAVDWSPAERALRLATVCGTDTDLRRAVDRLLAAHESASAFLEGPHRIDGEAIDDTAPTPTRIGAYRIVRELGRGGMGTVYLAERDDPTLRRTVAIKVVNVASQFIVNRFHTETEVLAALEHPGVARLYDAGTTESGVPYFVMEYVAGDDLLRYCDRQRATITERLRLFQRVCAAVQYAHQNFVVHRDLKPSNILVTAEGEPKLLDFGIAKILSAPDQAVEETAWFIRVLTPQYSSPEHIRGGRATTASDVYSLGVILYELLSGGRPYRLSSRTTAEIEKAVCEQEPALPSSATSADEAVADARATTVDGLRRRLKGDLDNIILKALEKNPVQRYATAADLADDLERYINGYPVQAKPGTTVYRAAKFLRRHKTSVAAAAVATFALVVGLAFALWQGHVARIERDRANQRFSDVRKMANSLIFKIHDGVQALPNSTPVRRMIIAEALTYLEQLRSDPAADEDLRIELSQAYQRIGIVQGQANVANLGDRDAAFDSFGKALDVLRPLVANPDAHHRAAVQFGRAALSIAGTASTAGDRRRAESAVREAERVAAGLTAFTADQDVTRFLGSLHFQHALLTPGGEALVHWRQAGDAFQRLLELQPDDADRRRNVALVEKYVGTHFENIQDAETALVHYRRALELDEKRVAAAPEDRLALSDLAIDLSNVAHSHWSAGRLGQAAALYERSLAIRQQLADTDRNDVFAKGRVEYVHAILADIYGRAGKLDLSLEHARKAVSLAETLSAIDSTHRSQLAEGLIVLGEAEARAGSAAAACRCFVRSRTIFTELAGQKLVPGQQTDRRQNEARVDRDLATCRTR